MSLEPGIRVGNLQQLNERFKCTHCKLLLRDAMQGDCGHRYCKNCVQSVWKEAQASSTQSQCAACKDEEDPGIISPDRTYPDHAIRREIKRLKVQCPHESCSEQMPLKELKDHELACPMRPQACRRCQAKVPRARMDEHERSECSKRPIECDACGDEVPHDELDEHKRNACVGSTRQCEFCGVRVKDDDAEMDEHLRSDCKVGWHRDNQCPYGCGSVENWQQHRAECVPRHLDRTLAAIVDLEAVNWQPAKKPTEVQPLTEEPDLVEKASEQVGKLAKSAAELKGEVDEFRSPGADAARAESLPQWLAQLTDLLKRGHEARAILSLLKNKREFYENELQQCKTDMQKEAESEGGKFEEEFAKKYEELNKSLAYKELYITELERRVDQLKLSSYNGVFVWKVEKLSQHRQPPAKSLFSPPFYTGRPGYKLCARLYLNGDADGKGTHVSVFVAIMQHDFDPLMAWPFEQTVKVEVLKCSDDEPHFEGSEFNPSKISNPKCLSRPITPINQAFGFSKFKAISEFFDKSQGFVRNDTAFFRFTVDRIGLP